MHHKMVKEIILLSPGEIEVPREKKKKLYSDINLLPKEGYTNTGKGKEVALPRQSAVVFFTSTSLSK